MTPEDRTLLLLGLLKAQRSHGYQVHEFIGKNLAHVADLKKASAYATLDKMAQEGLVRASTEQVGNRPLRKVYAITAAGERRFAALLRHRLRQGDDVRPAGGIAVMLLDEMDRSEARKLLAERLRLRREQLAMYAAAPGHGMGVGVDLAVELVKANLVAECAWLELAMKRLTSARPGVVVAPTGASTPARRTSHPGTRNAKRPTSRARAPARSPQRPARH